MALKNTSMINCFKTKYIRKWVFLSCMNSTSQLLYNNLLQLYSAGTTVLEIKGITSLGKSVEQYGFELNLQQVNAQQLYLLIILPKSGHLQSILSFRCVGRAQVGANLWLVLWQGGRSHKSQAILLSRCLQLSGVALQSVICWRSGRGQVHS